MKDKAESILACGVVLLFFWMMFSLAKCTLDKHKAEPKWRWKEICKDNDKRAEFIVNCAKAANPMSDEEGEDFGSPMRKNFTQFILRQRKRILLTLT